MSSPQRGQVIRGGPSTRQVRLIDQADGADPVGLAGPRERLWIERQSRRDAAQAVTPIPSGSRAGGRFHRSRG